MPRIPNSSDASSIWKMNDVYVGENGGEWPPTYVPYTPTTYYMVRATGGSPALSGGVTPNTNAYVHSLFPQLGSGGTTGSSWGYGGGNTDALSFMVTNNFGFTGYYAINGIGFGSFNNVTGYFGNSAPMAMQIVVGGATGGSGQWMWDLTANWSIELRGQQATGVNGCQVLELPVLDTYGNTQNLQFGTWYTFMIGYSGNSSPFNNWNSTQCISTVGTSNTLTVPLGTITMNWANATFNGGGWRGSSNGTSTTGGQHQIYGIHF